MIIITIPLVGNMRDILFKLRRLHKASIRNAAHKKKKRTEEVRIFLNNLQYKKCISLCSFF